MMVENLNWKCMIIHSVQVVSAKRSEAGFPYYRNPALERLADTDLALSHIMSQGQIRAMVIAFEIAVQSYYDSGPNPSDGHRFQNCSSSVEYDCREADHELPRSTHVQYCMQ